MKILMVHNRYHLKGGEDRVFEEETRMLRERGHLVELYEENSATISGVLGKLIVAFNLIFSIRTFLRVSAVLRRFQPDVVHVHNYFPIISPSIFYACSRLNVPVVHSLHNYRAICPTGLLMHKGKIDERSIDEGPFWSVREKVYRDSMIGTLVLALSIYAHRKMGTWRSKVDRYIAMTQFQKAKFIQAGWPASKISVKPNFAEDHHSPEADLDGGFCLFVGRLSQEKGVEDLLSAWKFVDYPLKIVGDGPLYEKVKHSDNPNVQVLGALSKDQVYRLMSAADLLIVTSRCYEAFGLVLVEAFSSATPVVAPALAGIPEIIDDGKNGLMYEAANVNDLSAKMNSLLDDPERLKELGRCARESYLSRFTEEQNYHQLIKIYKDLLACKGQSVTEVTVNEV